MNDRERAPIGLPPRRPMSVQNLLKANRDTEGQATTDQGGQPENILAPDEPKAALKQVTFYIDPSILARAKAAFKASSGLEDDNTWSNYVAKAVLAQTTVREETYNNGQPFKGGNDRLPPGRKI